MGTGSSVFYSFVGVFVCFFLSFSFLLLRGTEEKGGDFFFFFFLDSCEFITLPNQYSVLESLSGEPLHNQGASPVISGKSHII